jgi:hypothetical protein
MVDGIEDISLDEWNGEIGSVEYMQELCLGGGIGLVEESKQLRELYAVVIKYLGSVRRQRWKRICSLGLLVRNPLEPKGVGTQGVLSDERSATELLVRYSHENR